MNKLIKWLSATRIAAIALVVILAAALAMVVYESVTAGRPTRMAATPTPTATPKPTATPSPTPVSTPKTTYSAEQGLAAVQAVYDNGSGFGAQNRARFSDDFYTATKAKNLNYDPVLCSSTWPPANGMSYETSGISAQGIAAYVSVEHWAEGGGDHRLAVYVDLNTLKITNVICPAFHSGAY